MVNSANVAHFTNTWYPNGKLKTFKSMPKKCKEYWDDLVQDFGVQILNIFPGKDGILLEICCKKFGFIVEQWSKSTPIGPKSNARKISIDNVKKLLGHNLTDFSILVICNFKQFYFYDLATENLYGPIEGNTIVNNIPPVLKSLFGNKWAKRLNDSLRSGSFDGINDGNLQKRWGCLAKRIASQGKVEYDPSSYDQSNPSTHYTPDIGLNWLSWNKNPQCLPSWDSLLSKQGRACYTKCKNGNNTCFKWYNEETYSFMFCCDNLLLSPTFWKPDDENRCRGWEYAKNGSALIIPRHNRYDLTLNAAGYVQDYCRSHLLDYLSSSIAPDDMLIAYEGHTANGGEQKCGFWLIDESEADFVYAILKSSMFRAWCELTAHTNGGEGHFTVGMWDTFPLPALTNSQRSAVIIAGQELKKGWRWGQTKLDKLVDGLFAPAYSTHILSDRCRKRILAEGFLDAFYGA